MSEREVFSRVTALVFIVFIVAVMCLDLSAAAKIALILGTWLVAPVQ